MGACSDGQRDIVTFNGSNDLQLCIKECLKEEDCLYVSFMQGKICNQYTKVQESEDCSLVSGSTNEANLHVTFQKIRKGKRCSLRGFYVL